MSESVKSLRLERIKPTAAKEWLERYHPLGAGRGFRIALGVYWRGRLEGVLTLGNPISNKSGMSVGLRQHELIEVHKMHISDRCPRNSESRILAVVAILIRKHYPDLKALITYCDAEEKASAYKAAGWIKGRTFRYPMEFLIDGKWYTYRSATQRAIAKQATDKRYGSRTKWILPLTPEIAALAQRQSAGLPARIRRSDSDHAASVEQS